MEEYNVIGVMSGSSLDGLDVCLCRFCKGSQWSFEVIATKKYDLPSHVLDALSQSPKLEEDALKSLDNSFGEWIGSCINDFRKPYPSIDLIGVHGHTVHHRPADHISIQLGDGDRIAKLCGIPCVSDFRILDIMKGGQGAPLVPVGEYLLFSGYGAFVNLGGIANISVMNSRKITAWDIAPCNQVFNFFAQRVGLVYDDKGLMASTGQMDPSLLRFCEEKPYFKKSPPKSLGNHWVKQEFIETISFAGNVEDGLYTFTEFLSDLLVKTFDEYVEPKTRILITGGGAYNDFLIEQTRLKLEDRFTIEVPNKTLVEFKEAIIFGFLGLLRKRDEVNVFASVTGASEDSCSGKISLP